MCLNRFYGVTLIVGVVVGAAGAPQWSRGASISSRPAVLAADADQKDQGKNDADKKEEEPKGDPVDVDKLPKAVVDAVKKEMPGARITKAAKLDDGNYYLDDVKVGKKLWDVTVSPKGKIIKKVEMKD